MSDAEGNPLSDLSPSSRSISPTERSDESSRLKMVRLLAPRREQECGNDVGMVFFAPAQLCGDGMLHQSNAAVNEVDDCSEKEKQGHAPTHPTTPTFGGSAKRSSPKSEAAL